MNKKIWIDISENIAENCKWTRSTWNCYTVVTISHDKREIKTTLRYHYTSGRMVKISDCPHQYCQEFGTIRTVSHCWWECKMAQLLWNVAGSLSLSARLPPDPAVPLRRERRATCAPRNVYNHAPKNFLHKREKTETAYVSINKWMGSQTLVVLLRNKMENELLIYTTWMT